MGGPVAVFEVLSPEENVERMLVKLDDYANMGIPYIRVIDPKTQMTTSRTYGYAWLAEGGANLPPSQSNRGHLEALQR